MGKKPGQVEVAKRAERADARYSGAPCSYCGAPTRRMFEPGRNFQRFDEEQVLQRAVRANARAKSAPDKKCHDERQGEERDDCQRHCVVRVEHTKDDVLRRANGAHTALPPEAEVGERKD